MSAAVVKLNTVIVLLNPTYINDRCLMIVGNP